MSAQSEIHVEPLLPHPRPGLRVALVTETFPPEVNGVAMTIGRIADGLRRRNHTVHLIRPRQSDADLAGEGDLLATGLPIPRYPGLRFGLPAKAALTRLWKAARPDIVHVVTEGPLGWSAVSVARKLRLPLSSSFHTHFEAYSRHYGLGWVTAPVAAYMRRLHNRTDATMVPTRALADALNTAGYKNTLVVSRGVDTRLFNPGRRLDALRASWGVRETDLVVANVGRLAPEKNLDLLCETFTALRKMRPDARLLLVGDGPSLPALRRKYPEHIYVGMRHGEDLATHYASADLFLFPSLTETYGNVTAEALASGLPVVAYDCAAASELVVNGVNGLLADPGDSAGFTAAAIRLAEDELVLEKLRLGAAASVAHLDWERVHDTFADTLRQLVTAHERRGPWPGFLTSPAS